MTLRNSFGSDIEFAQDGPAHQGRIDQRGERHRIEVNGATLRGWVWQRGSVRPFVRKPDRGGNSYLAGKRVCGVQHQLIPIHVSLHRRRSVARSKIVSRLVGAHETEIRDQQISSSGDLDMKAEHIHRVANPVDTLAVRAKTQVHHVGDRAGGGMVSRYPFRINKVYRVS